MATINDNYACVKCGHDEHETGQLRASSGGFWAMLDIEDLTYTTISCTRCGHTDLFKATEASLTQMIADSVFN